MIDKRIMYSQGKKVRNISLQEAKDMAPKGEFLAYINKKEAKMLKNAGGSGIMTNAGIPSYNPNEDRAREEAGNQRGDNEGNSPGRNMAQFGTPTAPAATPDPRGPSELGVTTRTVNPVVPDLPKEYIGGKPFNVTPETRDEREEAKAVVERAKEKQSILDGNLLTNSFMPGNTPLNKEKFSVGNLLFNVGMFVTSPALFAKYQKGKRLYSGAKYVKDLAQPYTTKNLNKPFEVIEGLTKNIGLKDKNVIESFKNSLTNNLTSKTRTKNKPESVINTNINKNRDGINSLENANVLQDEYSILFQKLQTGNITDTERTRYTMLKNMLGI